MRGTGKRPRQQRDQDGEEKQHKKRLGHRDSFDNGELVIYRILCPNKVIGSVIGKGGKIINTIRQETNARIIIVDPFPSADKRVITIYCFVKDKDRKNVDEDNLEPLCSAQEALLQVHDAIVNAIDNGGDSENNDSSEAHILVPASQAASIIGKSGAIIKKLRSRFKTNIKVIPKDSTDAKNSFAMSFDNFVQIIGDSGSVRKALAAISTIMYKFSPKEEISIDASVPEIPPQNIIIPSDVPLIPAGGFYPTADSFPHLTRFVPPVITTTPHAPELHGITDPFSVLSMYPSSLPRVSGYGGSKRTKELVVRVLCPSDKIGRVIGKGGSTIKSIRQSSGANVDVENAKDEREECVITVSSNESTDDLKSAAVEAVLLLQGNINDEDDDKVNVRLLVPSKVVGCLIGRNGSIVNDMRKKTKADIRISKNEKAKRTASSDEIVEVYGEVVNVRDALAQITIKLRDDALSDRDGSNKTFKDCSQSAALDPLYTGGLSLSSMLSAVQAVAPLSYDRRVEPERGLGVHSGSGLYGYSSFQTRDNGYGSLPLYPSNSYAALPSFYEMPIPAHSLAKVLGKNGTNLDNIKKISGAIIEIVDSKSSRFERIAQISGTSEQKQTAQNLIQAFVMST